MRTKHNKCSGIAANSGADGADLIQWDCYEGANLQYQFVDKGNNWFELRAKHSGKCLEIAGNSTANGGNIRQWSCTGAANQQFKFY